MTPATHDKLEEILKEHWGYGSFRGIQRDIIESVCQGRDTLGLMPTGGGKSITFQVPALAREGTCLVVTPLIALMKDQVANLKRRGIRASAIHSGMTHDEILTTLENCVFGAVKILYVSPERLSSELFLTKLRHIKVSLIAIDEAHCICQWGYDFRPAYLGIAGVRHALPGVPVLALTATATPAVAADIQRQLGFRQPNVFRMSFERPNLAYVVRHVADKRGEALHILECVDGSAIVYARTRRRTKEIAEYLASNGIDATYFHAGLPNAERDTRQKAWTSGNVRVMVATNAFGMGIDKPDVRTVIHIDCPDCVESYFQEAGRAGRDGEKAYAVLLYNESDKRSLKKREQENFPPKDYIRKVYEHLAYFYQVAEGDGRGLCFQFDIDKFCYTFGHFPPRASSALKILARAGYIEYEEENDNSARAMFIIQRDDLYRLHGNTPAEDKTIEALLRKYSGLFCDFKNIDESFVASIAGLTAQEVHQCLKQLAQKRIIKFIPRSKTPFVRYIRQRVDPERISIPKEAYEQRRDSFVERARAMLAYATSGEECRSRLLLAYFGEKATKDCGHCDVCLDRKRQLPSKADFESAKGQILRILADGKPHHVTELAKIKLISEAIDEALEDLVQEETITIEDGYLAAATPKGNRQ